LKNAARRTPNYNGASPSHRIWGILLLTEQASKVFVVAALSMPLEVEKTRGVKLKKVLIGQFF